MIKPLGQPIATGDEHEAATPVSIHDMTVAYDRRPVLWDIDYDAPEGKLIGIIGPNGAGKSTLIKAALDRGPTASGRVRFYGKPYREQRDIVGYVPQRESVDWDFPVTALDVVTMGRYGKIGWCRPVTRAHREAALQCLESVGMADYAERQINQLSGGQQQRLCIARTIAVNPEVILMDEPCSALDPIATARIEDLMDELCEDYAIVIVTHSMQQAARVSRRVAYFHLGLLVEVDETDKIFTNPQQKLTEDYITGRIG